jgi:two-component system, OmpR family, response regulator ArlR
LKVLLVEDEKLIANAVKQVLKKDNYLVDLAFDGQDGLDNALTGQYDVIILDILLPKMDGLAVLREIRLSHIITPVIMLTAKGETKDKIRGLDSGADDYLAKPFEIDELLARIRALSRRQPEINAGTQLFFGNCTLDTQRLTVFQSVLNANLTIKESQILELLIINRNIVISKEKMIEKIWGYDTDAVDGNVETQVSLLRKKLCQVHSDMTVKAIRGTGYVLTPAE